MSAPRRSVRERGWGWRVASLVLVALAANAARADLPDLVRDWFAGEVQPAGKASVLGVACQRGYQMGTTCIVRILDLATGAPTAMERSYRFFGEPWRASEITLVRSSGPAPRVTIAQGLAALASRTALAAINAVVPIALAVLFWRMPRSRKPKE